ncbi:hypothetical protein ACJX0J_019780, partial [Zea mays]
PSMKTEFVKFYFYTIGDNVDVKMRELKRYLKKYYLDPSLPRFFGYSCDAAGRILGKNRTSLSPETLEALKVNYHIKESECLIQMMKKMIGKFDPVVEQMDVNSFL